MKFFAIFAAIMALAAAKRSGIYELSEAIQNPNTDPAMIPYLEAALNELISAAMAPQPIQPAPVVEAPVDTAAIDQLLDAIYNPATDPAMLPFLEAALSELLAPISNPIQPVPVITEPVPVVPTVMSAWSLQELSAAIENPNTDPALLPHLEDGLNALMANLMAGGHQEFIVIALPSNLTPISQEVSPVAPAPVVVPTPVEAPLEVVAPEAASSPLVQIIVNVNSQDAPVPSAPVVQPNPAPVVEWVPPPRPVPEQSIVPVYPIGIKPPQAIINPIEVNPIDVIAIGAPEVNPIDVIAIGAPEVNPIDVIAIGAPEVNPIDVIAVGAPEVNPIDLLHPLPVAVGAAVVGPLV